MSLIAPNGEHRRPKRLGEPWDFDPLLGLALIVLIATVVVTLTWSVTTSDTMAEHFAAVSPSTLATIDDTVPWAPPAAEAVPVTSPSTPAGAVWFTPSTSYCEYGTTRSGVAAGDGVVAVAPGNFARLHGTRWLILDGEFAGKTVTVEDVGPLADFDVWVASCTAAAAYGRHSIHVQQVTATG